MQLVIACTAEDKKLEGRIPKSFPGVLKIDPNYEGNKFLDSDYRQYKDDGIDEYTYFVEHLLERVNPTRTKFGTDKTIRTISSCFTPSDEAFALLVLDNKLHVWDAQHEKTLKDNQMKGSQLRMKKKYCNGHSKDKCGWVRKGVNYYNILHNEIETLRKEQNTDKSYLAKFRRQAGKTDDSDDDSNREGEDYDSDGETYNIPFANMGVLEQYRKNNN